MSANTATMKTEVETTPSSPADPLATSPDEASVGLLCQKCGLRPIRYRARQLCQTCYKHAHFGLKTSPRGLRPRKEPLPARCTYDTAHERCKSLWGLASLYPCVKCSSRAKDWAYDHSDPSELVGDSTARGHQGVPMRYSAWPEFYMPLCVLCHRQLDGIGVNDDW